MKHTQGLADKVGTSIVRFGDAFKFSVDIATCEKEEDAKRMYSLWNASNGMTTEQAVRYLEHGAEMEQELKEARGIIRECAISLEGESVSYAERVSEYADAINNLIAKMEGK